MADDGLRSRMREARDLLAKSQREMAQAVGVSTKSWQDYEAGKSVPNGRVFRALCTLGFDGHWLLTGQGAPINANSDTGGTAKASAPDVTESRLLEAGKFHRGAAVRLLKIVDVSAKRAGVTLPAEEKINLVIELYREMEAAAADGD